MSIGTIETKGVLTRAALRQAVCGACPTLSRDEAHEIVTAIFDEISKALLRGEFVKLRGFGNFKVKQKQARIGRNPITGVETVITPRRGITFKPSPALKARVNRLEVRPEIESEE